MTRCPSCHLRKPDALFTTIIGDRGKCLNCREVGRKMKPRKHAKGCATEARHACDCLKGRKIRTIQAEPISMTASDSALVKVARAEMKAFKRRGSPEIERPYAYIGASPDKGMVARKPFTRI